MKILFAASEIYPHAKTGGLADVVTSLTNELRSLGHDVKIVLPGYPCLLNHFSPHAGPTPTVNIDNIASYDLIHGRIPGIASDVILVRSDRLYNTDKIYGGNKFQLFLKFFALSHAVARISANKSTFNWSPDILHANDWHTGLCFHMLDMLGAKKVGRVFSIHNIAFAGRFPLSYRPIVENFAGGLSGSLFSACNEFSFLEEALLSADKINTVSPNYAAEIQTERFGFGFQNILKSRRRDLMGILNGVDYKVWHPEQDPHLPLKNCCFDAADKSEIKSLLQSNNNMPIRKDVTLCSFTNRMTHQKMIDVILRAAADADPTKFQFIFHGNGEEQYLNKLEELSARRNIAYIPGFSERTEHLLLSGADVCLSPSRFEPCGLNALYAMRYGALPLVRPVGGYCDTIRDEFSANSKGMGNGFFMPAESPRAMIHSLNQIRSIRKNAQYWESLVQNAKNCNFSWSESAKKYLTLYNAAIRKRNAIHEFGIAPTAPSHAAVRTLAS